MARNGPRRRVAPGIYQDARGYEAIVGKGAGPQVSRRFPPGTPLGVMQRWQLATKAARRPAGTHGAGTLRTDAPRYLATLPEGSHAYVAADIHLRHWLSTPLADRRRDTLQRAEVKAQLATWEAEGAAASTLNHRVRILRALYRELDGEGPNPTTGIGKRRQPEGEPRAVPLDVARAILSYLRPGSATRLRLQVMLTTGLPHAQLVRLARRDVNWAGASFYARPRRKGAGTAGTWLPLLPAAVEALAAYDEAGLWERPFSTAAMRSAFLRAVAKYQAGHPDVPLPPNLHPYDLRHAFLTAAYQATGDEGAAQALGQHADRRTTRRYTLGAVSDRTQAAITALAQITRWHRVADEVEKHPGFPHAPVAQLDRALASGAKGEPSEIPEQSSTYADFPGFGHAGTGPKKA